MLIFLTLKQFETESVGADQVNARTIVQPVRHAAEAVLRVVWHPKHVHEPVVCVQSVRADAADHERQPQPDGVG